MKGYNMNNEESAYAEALDEAVKALQKAVKAGSEVYEVYCDPDWADSELVKLTRMLDETATMHRNMYTQNYKKGDDNE